MAINELKKQLANHAVEQGIDFAFSRLCDILIEDTDRYSEYLQLRMRYTDYAKRMVIGAESAEELGTLWNMISHSLLTFIKRLTTLDIKPGLIEIPRPKNNRGQLLYQIPHKMAKDAVSICKIRVAYLESVLRRNWRTHGNDEYRSNIRVAELMAVELINVGKYPAFHIQALRDDPIQFLDYDDYTEWGFCVTPLKLGSFPLLLRISVLEVRNGREIKKDVIIEEQILVTNKTPDLQQENYKEGEQFYFSYEKDDSIDQKDDKISPDNYGKSNGGGLRQSLSLKQSLGSKLAPQQIQLMKLLQIPSAALEQRIQEEIVANPALEQDNRIENLNVGIPELYIDVEDFPDENLVLQKGTYYELDDYLMNYREDNPMNYKLIDDYYNIDERNRTNPIAFEHTFHEHLKKQLGLLKLKSEKEAKIAFQIIGNIDNDGYMRREISGILDDLATKQNLNTDEETVVTILEKIQRFEPSGVGCRNLQECLLIQLRDKLDKENLTHESRLAFMLSVRLINEYFEEFTNKNYSILQHHLEVAEDDLHNAINQILKLNPRPASGFATKSDRALNYFIPDFITKSKDGELELTLNTLNAPDLRVSNQFRDMLEDFRKRIENQAHSSTKQKDAVTFIKDKIASAQWFINAIRQRQQTMLRVMNSILAYQYEYFSSGDKEKIRPMILKDLSEITGLDISTVSRVVNNKYVQTEFGTKRLSEFLSGNRQTQKGEEVLTLEVKNILIRIIETENKRKPLSDEKLRSHLQQGGYNISRRTVAKYREQMNIPVARLRKKL